MRSKYLISTEELAANLDKIKLVDASYYLPFMNRDRYQEYLDKRITNRTVFFDVDVIADQTSSLKHMLPDEEFFIENMKKLDIQKDMIICVYDQSNFGMFSAPRAALTLRHFGAQNVRVLDGGMKKWEQEKRPVVEGPPDAVVEDLNGDFSYKAVQTRKIVDLDQMREMAAQLYNS